MKLFVWDFHGVLEKGTEQAVLEITNKVCEEYKTPFRLNEESMQRLYGQKWIDYFRELSPDSTDEELEAMVSRALEIQTTEKPHIKYIKPMDHAEKVLQTIKDKGNSNILLSNTNPERIVDFTESVGLMYLFDVHIGVDHHRGEQRKSKISALKEYLEGKTFDKIIVIGDHLEDIQAGKEVNAVTYLFSRTGDFPDVDADYKISNLEEVLNEL